MKRNTDDNNMRKSTFPRWQCLNEHDKWVEECPGHIVWFDRPPSHIDRETYAPGSKVVKIVRAAKREKLVFEGTAARSMWDGCMVKAPNSAHDYAAFAERHLGKRIRCTFEVLP